MKQKLLTDIELDVHELKFLMDTFSKEPTQTLSELLKRSILRMQDRLEQLSEEIEAVPVEDSPSAIAEVESEVPIVEEQAPVIEGIEYPVIEEKVVEENEATALGEDEPVIVQEPQAVVEETVIEEPVVEDEMEEKEVEDELEDDESLLIEEPKAAVLGESIKMAAGLRHSISLNDSFRFSREIFGGDPELMNRVIEQISVMSSYKTAVAFLASKVSVNEENEAMTDFLELLKKFMGKLYVVPTPVGNLEDMTFRAIKVLKEVDLILAEDTRTSGILLKHFEIKNAMQSHHKFNEHKTVESVVNRIKAGETVALISDAGTPGISDPGFLVVRECVRNGIEVQCLPGATAFVPALVASGLPNEKFCFEGFLPQKKGRQTRLKALAEEHRTMVFYESPHRLLKTLTQFAEYFGTERQATVSREISKLHEETVRGSLAELIEHFTATEPRGEIVIVLAGIDD